MDSRYPLAGVPDSFHAGAGVSSHAEAASARGRTITPTDYGPSLA